MSRGDWRHDSSADTTGGHNDVVSNPASQGASGRQGEGRGYGLVWFASVMLGIVGCFNLIYGIAAIANSNGSRSNLEAALGRPRGWLRCS